MPVLEREQTGLPDAAKYPFIVRCDQPGCFYFVSAKNHTEGVTALTTHTCPHTGGPTRQGLMMSKTILENAWIKLDALLETILDDNLEEEDRKALRNQCRGMAEVLAMFMSPHFTTGDEVSREAKRRYNSKKAGEPVETPGLGSLRLAPPPGTPSKYTTAAAPKPAHKLTDTEVAAIKNALAAGWDAGDLAKVYKVSEDIIKSVAA
jgi:hypothetical protein